MIVDSIIVPGGINFAEGCGCAASKIWKNPVLQIFFFFKIWYNGNLELGTMCKITQLWLLSPLLPLLYRFSCLVLRIFLPKKPTHTTHLSLEARI